MNGPQTPSYPAMNADYDLAVAFKAANLASSNSPNANPNYSHNLTASSPQFNHISSSPTKASPYISPRLAHSGAPRPLSGVMSSSSDRGSSSPVMPNEPFANTAQLNRSSSQYSQHSQHRGLGINGVSGYDNNNNNNNNYNNNISSSSGGYNSQQPGFTTNGNNDHRHQRNPSSASFQGAPISQDSNYKSQFDPASQPKYLPQQQHQQQQLQQHHHHHHHQQQPQQLQPQQLQPPQNQPQQNQQNLPPSIPLPSQPSSQSPLNTRPTRKTENGKPLVEDNEDLINNGIFPAKTDAQRDWQQRGAATLIETEKNAETGEIRTKIVKKGVTDFKFGRTLGEGSYSTVVAAVDRQTSKEYAIKVLDKRHIIKEKKVKYVNIEKNTLNRLGEHPGIVRLYYTFQDERSLYFVLDFASNGELLSLIKKLGTLDIECTRYYGAQLLDAVEFMHNNGIYHRDLKPENILLDDKMRIKITDFGTAKMIDSLKDEDGKDTNKYPSDVRTSSFVGTAEYVSPELLTEKATGKEADIWAFGCIIYQLIAGRPPFKAGNEYQTFQKIVKLQYSYSPGFPYLARDLIKRVLVLNPKDRYVIQQIKNHPFFEGINWDRKALWKRPHPRLLPYRASAKSIVNPLKVPPTLSTRTVPAPHRSHGHGHHHGHNQPQQASQQQLQPQQQQQQQASQQQYVNKQQNIVTPASAAIAALAKRPVVRKPTATSPAVPSSKPAGSSPGPSGMNIATQNLSTTAAARGSSPPVSASGPSYPRQSNSGSPFIGSSSSSGFSNSSIAATSGAARGGRINQGPPQASQSSQTNVISNGSGNSNKLPPPRGMAQLNTSAANSNVNSRTDLPAAAAANATMTASSRSVGGSGGTVPSPTTAMTTVTTPTTPGSVGERYTTTPSPTAQNLLQQQVQSPNQQSHPRRSLESRPPSQLDIDWANVLQHHDERILSLGLVYVATTAANNHDEDDNNSKDGKDDSNSKDNHRLSKFFSISKRKKRNLIVTTAARCLIVNPDDKRIRYEINLMAPGINVREYPYNKKTGFGSFSLETATKLFTIEDPRGTSEWLSILVKAREYGTQLLIKQEKINAMTAAAAAAASMNTIAGQSQNATALSAATIAANNNNNNNIGSNNNVAMVGNKQFGGKPSIASDSAATSLFLQRNEERKLLRRMKF